jgi:hypothetical protein
MSLVYHSRTRYYVDIATNSAQNRKKCILPALKSPHFAQTIPLRGPSLPKPKLQLSHSLPKTPFNQSAQQKYCQNRPLSVCRPRPGPNIHKSRAASHRCRPAAYLPPSRVQRLCLQAISLHLSPQIKQYVAPISLAIICPNMPRAPPYCETVPSRPLPLPASRSSALSLG